MANHGYCKNCWWYKKENKHFNCFMHTNTVQDNSYCPDYTNRLKEEKKFGKLEDWIDKF